MKNWEDYLRRRAKEIIDIEEQTNYTIRDKKVLVTSESWNNMPYGKSKKKGFGRIFTVESVIFGYYDVQINCREEFNGKPAILWLHQVQFQP